MDEEEEISKAEQAVSQGDLNPVEETDTRTDASLPTVTDQQDPIQESVDFVNRTVRDRDRGYEEAVTYLLDRLFGGDITRASSKNPKKEDSYRRLCERQDLAVDIPMLSRMLRVAAQTRFFSENDVDASSLSFTHKAELIKLKNDAAKVTFVLEVLATPQSSRELALKIKRMKSATPADDTNLAATKRRLDTLRQALCMTEVAELLQSRDQTIMADESVRTAVTGLKETISHFSELCENFLAASDQPLAV